MSDRINSFAAMTCAVLSLHMYPLGKKAEEPGWLQVPEAP